MLARLCYHTIFNIRLLTDTSNLFNLTAMMKVIFFS